MGVVVGNAVGDAVGTAVGLAVGLDVGEGVGIAVGVAVGLAVGLAVGEGVGMAVGSAVGAAVGVTVGAGAHVSSAGFRLYPALHRVHRVVSQLQHAHVGAHVLGTQYAVLPPAANGTVTSVMLSMHTVHGAPAMEKGSQP